LKLTFRYSDSADTQSGVNTSFEFPDLPTATNVNEKIVEIGQLVGKLTEAILYISCPEVGIVEEPIKLTRESTLSVYHLFYETLLRFERRGEKRLESRKLTIIRPIPAPIQKQKPKTRGRGPTSLTHFLIHPRAVSARSGEQKNYLNVISLLADHCLALLNAPAFTEQATPWEFAGFYPFWHDKGAGTKARKQRSK
jgi:hypothetical protein